jgi:hypothetical protein
VPGQARPQLELQERRGEERRGEGTVDGDAGLCTRTLIKISTPEQAAAWWMWTPCICEL